MKNKHSFRRLCAVSLSVITAMSFLTRDMVQAEEKILYISDVMLFQAEDISDAEADCKNHGYIPFGKNLNDGTGEDYVILGYKTTDNRSEAITDLSVLSMGTGYEIRSYREILNSQLSKFEQLAAETFRIIPEFRSNLGKGSPAAEMALKLLNYYWFDSVEIEIEDQIVTFPVNMKFGDFLLSDLCNSESENFKPDVLAAILQRGSTGLVNMMYSTFIPAAADYNPEIEYFEGEYIVAVDKAQEFNYNLVDELSDSEMQETLPAQTEATADTTETTSADTEAQTEETTAESTDAVTDATAAEETTETTAEITDETTAESTDAVSDTTAAEETTETTAEITDETTAETTAETTTEADETTETTAESTSIENVECMLKCGPDYGNWAERIGLTGMVDLLDSGEIDSEFEMVYDERVRLIKKAVQDFAERYLDAEARMEALGLDAMIGDADASQSAAEVLDEAAGSSLLGGDKQHSEDLYYIQAYNVLDQYMYNDYMTVAEYLIEIGSVPYLDDPSELHPFYPLAAALTNAQTYLMQINGVASMAMYLVNDDTITEKAKPLFDDLDDKIKEYGKKDGMISVWEGVDRSKYDELYAETNQKIFDDNAGKTLASVTGERTDALSVIEKIISITQTVSMVVGAMAACITFVSSVGVAVGTWQAVVTASACWAFAKSGGILAALIGGAGAAIMWLSAASLTISIVIMLVNIGISIYRTHFYEEDYIDAAFKSAVPGTILDTNDSSEYVYYYPAKGSGIIEDYGSYDKEYLHGYGDLNACEGKDDRWSVLCWTKDANAGSPLQLRPEGYCFLAKSDQNPVPGYTALNNFNEKVPADLNAYADKRWAPMTCLFYTTEDDLAADIVSWADTIGTNDQYVTEIAVQIGSSAEEAAAGLRENGFIPFDNNLTPNVSGSVTLLGYKKSSTVTNAVTDIRILPKDADASSVSKDYTKVGETANGDAVYTTTSINNKQPIVAEFAAIGSMSSRKAAHSALMTFGNLPYDFMSGAEFNPESADAGEAADGTHLMLTYKQAMQYLSALQLSSGETREIALADLVNNGYSFIDRNLTPGTGTYTYLGYKGSSSAYGCITDIRIMKDGVDFETVKNYSRYQYLGYTVFGDMIFYSTDTKMGKPIIADFGVLGSYDDRDSSSKIISSFDDLPFDFARAQEYTPPKPLTDAERQQIIQQEAKDREKDDNNGDREESSTPEKKDSVFLTFTATRAPQYINKLSIVSYYGNETAAKRDLQAQGFTILNQNLTPFLYRTYTYLGYATTENPAAALTDIRMSPNNTAQTQMFGSVNYTIAKTDSPKCGVTPQGDGMYVTSFDTHGDPIVADFVIVNNCKDAPAGYEPIMTFAGLPYNFNTPGYGFSSLNCVTWDWKDLYWAQQEYKKLFPIDVYIYYRPNTAYLPTTSDGEAATKYIAGITPFVGQKATIGGEPVTKNIPGVTPFIEQKASNEVGLIAKSFAEKYGSDLITNMVAGSRFGIADDMLKGTDYDVDYPLETDHAPGTAIMINYTYNPKRAITDFASYTAAPGADALQPSYGTQEGGGYAAQDPYYYLRSEHKVSAKTSCLYWLQGFSPTHDYLAGINKVPDTEMYNDKRLDMKPEDFEEAGYWTPKYSTADYTVNWKSSTLRCKGIFAAGPMGGKAPLTYDDILFTNNGEGMENDSAWRPVQDIRLRNCPRAHNLAYRSLSNASSALYMFVRGEKPTEKQYISNVVLAVADTQTQIDAMKKEKTEAQSDMIYAMNKTNIESCMMTLLCSCTDEIIPHNLCVTFADDYDPENTLEDREIYDKIKSDFDYCASLNHADQTALKRLWDYIVGNDDAEYKELEDFDDLKEWQAKYPDERNRYPKSGGYGMPWQYVIRDYQSAEGLESLEDNVYVAMIGVSRTDNPNEAVRGLLKYRPESGFAPETIKVGNVTYTRCGKEPVRDIHETYYIYQSKNISLGDPLTSVDFSDCPYVSGAKTAKTATSEKENAKTTVDADSLVYLHGKCDDRKGYVGRLYLGRGDKKKDAACDLLNQGATYVLDIDLNKGGDSYVFLGYSKVSTTDDAAYDAIVLTGDQPAVTKNAKGLDCVMIDGKEYYPARTSIGKQICINPADNAYIYYRSGSPLTNETPLMKLGVSECDRVPDNTGLVQPWEYILANGKSKYNVGSNRLAFTDEKHTELLDNRVYLYALRNPANGVFIKPGAEITGGHCNEMMTYGSYYIKLK